MNAALLLFSNPPTSIQKMQEMDKELRWLAGSVGRYAQVAAVFPLGATNCEYTSSARRFFHADIVRAQLLYILCTVPLSRSYFLNRVCVCVLANAYSMDAVASDYFLHIDCTCKTLIGQ